jgi:Protein kinase domain
VGKAHDAGFVHRDLKPDNIFIVVNDDEELVKVLDFGVAKAISGTFGEGSARTRTGALIGTPYYMSPEQAQGDRSVDFRSDLWSIGVIAFECLTGVRPFDSEGLGSLVLQICAGPIPVPSQIAQVPPGFDDWFATAVCRNPDGRFQSAREMSDALRMVLTPNDLADATGRIQFPLHSAELRSATYRSSPGASPAPLQQSQPQYQSGESAPVTVPLPVAPTPQPAHVGVIQQSSPWTAPVRDLNQTTGGAAATEVQIPMKSSGIVWVIALGLLGTIGLIGTLVLVRVVTHRNAPEEPAVAASAPPAELAPSATAEPSAEPEVAVPSASAQPPPSTPEPSPTKVAAPVKRTKPEPAKTKEPVKVTPKPTATGNRLGI